jgi:hypothetical protein
MSSTTNKQPDANDLAAKMMQGARRLNQPPADVMQPKATVQSAVVAPAVHEEVPVMAEIRLTPTTDEAPSKRVAKRVRDSATSENQLAADISVDPGKATCTLSVRVPRKLRAELNLMAMQARYGGADGPATVNDLVLEAIDTFLRQRRTSRAA